MAHFHFPVRDLTGKVRKTGACSFAIGGVADLYMGEWAQGNSRQIVLRIQLVVIS
jgi:hypothetical protein